MRRRTCRRSGCSTVSLELVDRLVERRPRSSRKASAESSTATLEDRPGGGLGVDGRRDAVHRRELAPRPGLAHRDDARSASRRRSSSRYSARPPGSPAERRARREHVRDRAPGSSGRRPRPSPRGSRRSSTTSASSGIAKGLDELLPCRVDEIGPLRRHGASRLLPASAGAARCVRDATALDRLERKLLSSMFGCSSAHVGVSRISR